MIAPARAAAYEVLMAVSAGRADLPDALASARTNLRDDRDKALAAEIAIGVQRWRAALDHVIVHFAKRPTTRLDEEVLEILRLSAYQLLHLTRVPAAAIVDDAVNLAGRAGKRSASGLVNAVLRAISRNRASLPLPPAPADAGDRDRALDYLSITLSHPRWLAARWLDRYGFEATQRWLRFNNQPAPLTLRVNRLRSSRGDLVARLENDDVRVRAGRFAPDGLVVEDGHPLRGAIADEGWFFVQDEASQLVALLAGSDPGRRVLDVCASPGGKTTAMAARMKETDRLIACDVRDRRIDLLRRTVAASGARNVRLVQADLLRPLPLARAFDCVLVDAPCSGLGTLRRDPDIRWRRDERDLETLAASQLAMLRHAAEGVTPGGRLIYATCSSEPEENEAVADQFLAAAPDFAAADLRQFPTLVPADVIDARGHLRTYPHIHELEAFFGAVFTREHSQA
jgi:16S rRNA (cytosine967-C5)-methyltransferase